MHIKFKTMPYLYMQSQGPAAIRDHQVRILTIPASSSEKTQQQPVRLCPLCTLFPGPQIFLNPLEACCHQGWPNEIPMTQSPTHWLPPASPAARRSGPSLCPPSLEPYLYYLHSERPAIISNKQLCLCHWRSAAIPDNQRPEAIRYYHLCSHISLHPCCHLGQALHAISDICYH